MVSVSLVAESLVGGSAFAACPDKLSYRIPYSVSGKTLMTDFNLEIPVTRLDIPVAKLDTAPAAGPAGIALKELFAAVNSGDVAGVRNRVDVAGATKTYGSLEKFVEGFRGSLAPAGEFTAVAILPASGAVRFVLKGAAEKAFRVFGFRLQNQKYIMEDLSPDAVYSLELSALRLAAAPAAIPAGSTRIPLSGNGDSCAPALVAASKRLAGPVAAKTSGVPAINFVTDCRHALELDKVDDFVSCFTPDRAKQFRGTIAALPPDQRTRFVQSQLNTGDPSFALLGGDLTVVFYKRDNMGKAPVYRHVNVVRTSSGYELIDSLTSGVFDSLLSSDDFVDRVSKLFR